MRPDTRQRPFDLAPFCRAAVVLATAAFWAVRINVAWAQPVLELTTPQGCGLGVVVGPDVELTVRANGLPADGGVIVQITETNALSQKSTDSISLSAAMPERTLAHLSGAPFPAGSLLITAKVSGQSASALCELNVAGSGTPTSTARPSDTVPAATATPSPTATATTSPSPPPSATATSTPTETQTTAAVATPTASETLMSPPETPTATPSSTAIPSPTTTTASGLPGDANCDGRVGAPDPTRELMLLSQNGRATCRGDDADGDGELTVADVAATVARMFGR